MRNHWMSMEFRRKKKGYVMLPSMACPIINLPRLDYVKRDKISELKCRKA